MWQRVHQRQNGWDKLNQNLSIKPDWGSLLRQRDSFVGETGYWSLS